MTVELVAQPGAGRTFGAERKVRLGDVGPHGRLRLDALARYLQDIASDDSQEAGMPREHAWLVRRTTLAVHQPVRLGEQLTLVTFCSGVGARWAERRTSVSGSRGARVEAAAIWVCTDVANGRPVSVPDEFHEIYGQSAAGRRVSARLTIGGSADSAPSRAWPLRATDFDVLGHMNNAAYWVAIEDELDRRGDASAALATLEYRSSIEPDDAIELRVDDGGDGRLTMWLTRGSDVCAAATVQLDSRGASGRAE